MTDIRTTTFNLYIIPNIYSDRGWEFNLIEDGKWNPYDSDRASGPEINILIGSYTVPIPEESILVDMGMAKVDELKKHHAERIIEENTTIKEYESKFLLLPCSD